MTLNPRCAHDVFGCKENASQVKAYRDEACPFFPFRFLRGRARRKVARRWGLREARGSMGGGVDPGNAENCGEEKGREGYSYKACTNRNSADDCA